MSTMRSLAKEASAPASEIPALVTSFEEHRASLAERKHYRDAKKINDRLPDAAATIVEVPRRKHFPTTEEGRLEWNRRAAPKTVQRGKPLLRCRLCCAPALASAIAPPDLAAAPMLQQPPAPAGQERP